MPLYSSKPSSISAVILAGGQGKRMGGVNKALLSLGGESFLERQIRMLGSDVDEIIVVANERASEIAATLAKERPVRIVPDFYVGEGPLAGLHAGLSAATSPEAWVIGCDHPFVDAAVLRMLSIELRNDVYQAIIPVILERPQPLFAVYRSHVGQMANDLLLNGERRLLALLDRIEWRSVSDREFIGQGMPLSFADDVDTPEQYERALRTYSELQ
jgi:molybdopterin-guanine dinucleotide biosynthesis protein A